MPNDAPKEGICHILLQKEDLRATLIWQRRQVSHSVARGDRGRKKEPHLGVLGAATSGILAHGHAPTGSPAELA